ncbi:transglycosylase SLT domain-containing protein [Roseomonas sp. CCTCC AB2023176]|uniref:transglycosylase SLT domain-containing protein n=1 Tax=Roseomonas sp. CCTCC AB2023176 TaxID=3342640 RepID=UPI0035DCF2BB
MPGGSRRLGCALAILAACALRPWPAAASDADACLAAIAQVEPGSGLPAGLLTAVALVESGRFDPTTGRVQPWPWSWNASGAPGYAADRTAAVGAVAALRARGVASVDVGCMQVNLLHHPDAFRGLDDAFDPVANVRYAAGFLLRLRAETGDWGLAVARYHSGDPVRGAGYAARVALAQLGRAWARGGAVRLHRGCGGRGAAVLVVRAGTDEGGARAQVVCQGSAAGGLPGVARAGLRENGVRAPAVSAAVVGPPGLLAPAIPQPAAGAAPVASVHRIASRRTRLAAPRPERARVGWP